MNRIGRPFWICPNASLAGAPLFGTIVFASPITLRAGCAYRKGVFE
jgi:hypothetical protein